MVEIEVFDPEMLVFIDDTGCDKCNLVRQCGYSVRGLTPVTNLLYMENVYLQFE